MFEKSYTYDDISIIPLDMCEMTLPDEVDLCVNFVDTLLASPLLLETTLDTSFTIIDIPNAYSEIAKNLILKTNELNPNAKIVIGNIQSLEGYQYLSYLGVCAVKVEGSASLIRQLANYRHEQQQQYPEKNYPLIIVNDKIEGSNDVVKAIALGADFIMAQESIRYYWDEDLRSVMFHLGCHQVEDLKHLSDEYFRLRN